VRQCYADLTQSHAEIRLLRAWLATDFRGIPADAVIKLDSDFSDATLEMKDTLAQYDAVSARLNNGDGPESEDTMAAVPFDSLTAENQTQIMKLMMCHLRTHFKQFITKPTLSLQKNLMLQLQYLFTLVSGENPVPELDVMTRVNRELLDTLRRCSCGQTAPQMAQNTSIKFANSPSNTYHSPAPKLASRQQKTVVAVKAFSPPAVLTDYEYISQAERESIAAIYTRRKKRVYNQLHKLVLSKCFADENALFSNYKQRAEGLFPGFKGSEKLVPAHVRNDHSYLYHVSDGEAGRKLQWPSFTVATVEQVLEKLDTCPLDADTQADVERLQNEYDELVKLHAELQKAVKLMQGSYTKLDGKQVPVTDNSGRPMTGLLKLREGIDIMLNNPQLRKDTGLQQRLTELIAEHNDLVSKNKDLIAVYTKALQCARADEANSTPANVSTVVTTGGCRAKQRSKHRAKTPTAAKKGRRGG
jgi:hypothetical protein